MIAVTCVSASVAGNDRCCASARHARAAPPWRSPPRTACSCRARPGVVDHSRGELLTVALVVLIEPNHRRQRPVDRPPAPALLTADQHHHVGGGPAHPRHELAQRLDRRRIPLEFARGQERPIQLQIMRVGAHRVRRPLKMRQPRQIPLDRLDNQPVAAHQRPRHGARPRSRHAAHAEPTRHPRDRRVDPVSRLHRDRVARRKLRRPLDRDHVDDALKIRVATDDASRAPATAARECGPLPTKATHAAMTATSATRL